MAHWAEIDENNIVVRVIVGNDDDLKGDEGYQWLIDNLGGTWIKTSYNTHGGKHLFGGFPLRKNFGNVGFYYDLERDAFIPPKPYNSWILNEDTCLWEAPTSYPTDSRKYIWVEYDLNWQPIESEE